MSTSSSGAVLTMRSSAGNPVARKMPRFAEHFEFDGTQESYWMVRRSVESTFSGIRFPHTWRKRALLLVSLVGIVLAFAVLSVATLEPAVAALNLMLLVGVFLCLAFVLAFSNAVMYVMQMVILVGCCLGISVGAWPGWSLHEKETRLWARVYVLATLRSAAAREVTHTLGENFEGSLQELIHTSRLLSL